MAYSLINTLLFNYRMFPRPVARLLPVKVGRRTDFKGLRRGSIVFREGAVIRKSMVRLGCSSWQLYSDRAMRTLLWMPGKSRLVLGNDVDFCTGSRVVITSGAELSVGNDFFLNQNSLIYCSKSISFGDHCTVGWDSQIYDCDFHVCFDADAGEPVNPVGPVRIGDNVWIANRCTIAKGSVIPSDSVVASNSLVNKDFSYLSSKGNLIAGMPAALKRTGISRIFDRKEETRLRRKYLRGTPAGRQAGTQAPCKGR